MNTQWADAAIFQPRRRGSLTEQITDHLRRRVVSGDLAVERQLPSLRKLARLYGVSLPTIHAAVHALAALGFVRISHGVGVYVSRPRSHTAVCSHAWRSATSQEIALMRAAIDGQMPVVLAAEVRRQPVVRLPRSLSDISFLANERYVRRSGYPEFFIRADLALHHAIAASLRSAEFMASLHEHLGHRLLPALMTVADVQATDDELHAAHIELVGKLLAGEALATGRIARFIARRELASLQHVLG